MKYENQILIIIKHGIQRQIMLLHIYTGLEGQNGLVICRISQHIRPASSTLFISLAFLAAGPYALYWNVTVFLFASEGSQSSSG